MDFSKNLDDIRSYFDKTLKNFGPTPRGVDWNNEETRKTRFDQLAKILDPAQEFSLLDYGSGYGALAEYLLASDYPLSHYLGFDILPSMVAEGQRLFKVDARIQFSATLEDVPPMDYAIACGVFNMKQDADYSSWTEFVLDCLDQMNDHSTKGFSVNFLTKYSDADRMRSDLYYADPCFLFDHCKTHYSKNVALLHDYNLFDFTLLIRK